MARVFASVSNQYISVASCPVTAEPITIALWFNTASAATNQSVCGIYANDTNWFQIFLHSGQKVRARIRGGATSSAAETTTNYSASTWHHGCAVFASDTSRAIYIDGGSKGTDVTEVTVANTTNTIVGNTLPSGGDWFNGQAAEFAIWNAALTDAEVAVLARGVSPLLVRPESLVFYCPLIRDDDEDIIGGLSLTATNNPTVGAHTRVYYPGVIGIGVPPAEAGRQPRPPAAYFDGPTIF